MLGVTMAENLGQRKILPFRRESSRVKETPSEYVSWRTVHMRKTQRIGAMVLLVLLAVAIYGFLETRRPPEEKQSVVAVKALVDQSSLTTALQLAPLATTHEERTLAEEALRLADFDVDQAFDNALRRARLHPPALSAEGKQAQARLDKEEKLLEADQELVKQLTDQSAKASEAKKDALKADLLQAQADVDLAQDEVNDAKQDLIRAGGDLTDRIEALKKQHEETTHNSSTAIPTGPEPVDQLGVIRHMLLWRQLHQKQMQLWQAKGESDAIIAQLTVKHDALDAEVDKEKAAIPELAHHSKTAAASEPVPAQVSAANKSQDESADLLKKTQQLALNQKILAAYDLRISTKKQLSAVYEQWIDLVVAHQRAMLHRILIGLAIIFAIGLLGLYVSGWIDSLVKKVSMDRRQVESLRTVARVSLQVIALCMILLVLFGPPGQLGTFLGLAGAGLTVALKDFIVGFLGWFVLMGKNGIRLGDWVEINGVTGEVVQIGPFHTVLLETGNWTDSGHPTGRRVTFTNGYAIEGHYFNFSTSGQWLWDELQVVLPAGHDSYPLVDAIHKKVVEATRESAEIAEREWRSAGNSRELSSFSAEPAISVKPVVNGIEVSVRYIARATERYKLRSQLNQAVVDMLGGKSEKVEEHARK
jgi:small-conductance mechanosensitive channel